MKKTILIISLALVLISSCTQKEVEPVYNIDLLEVYSHAQELVDLNYYVNERYISVQHPDDETKIYFTVKESESLYVINSWVSWVYNNNDYGYKRWRSEVRFEKGVFVGAIIRFN